MKINIIEDNELAYLAKIKEDKIKLYRSQSCMWNDSVKGEKIGTIKDTGDKIKIELYGIQFKLEYHEFKELSTLMKLKLEHDKNL